MGSPGDVLAVLEPELELELELEVRLELDAGAAGSPCSGAGTTFPIIMLGAREGEWMELAWELDGKMQLVDEY